MNYSPKNKKFFFLGVVLFFYGLLVVPLLVLNTQNRQETRGRAADLRTTADATCGNAPTDTIIIVDRSGSMSPANKLPPTKTAAKNFVDVIAQDPRNKVALVTFSSKAALVTPLSADYAATKTNIDAIKPDGWTCIECAIKAANQELVAHGRPGIKKVIVLLTDGQANYIEGTDKQVSTIIADQKALDAATSGYNASKTQFFTIGLGDPNATGNERFFNPDLLKKIATLTAGKFYFPLPQELNNVYHDISLIIGKAAVSGLVFNDANGNGVFDTGESTLPNWTLNLVSSTTNKTVTTDSTGAFIFTNVCDGDYTLKQAPQSGWIQTFPSDPNGHSFKITNGFSIPNKNFGNKVTPLATPTASPSGTTTLSLTVLLDGIGNRGDNTNPDLSSLSNKDPLHPIIETDVQVFNASNQLVSSGAGVVRYNSAGGNYKGDLSVPSSTLSQGSYTIKVKARRYLRKLVPGIQTIIPDKANQITPVALVAGDVNNDNKLNILDYNLLLDCYSDLSVAANCASEEKKIVADVNDDGFVNQVDYNLFLREISTQPGN